MGVAAPSAGGARERPVPATCTEEVSGRFVVAIFVVHGTRFSAFSSAGRGLTGKSPTFISSPLGTVSVPCSEAKMKSTKRFLTR